MILQLRGVFSGLHYQLGVRFELSFALFSTMALSAPCYLLHQGLPHHFPQLFAMQLSFRMSLSSANL